MGGMNVWLWGEKYPGYMDALVPMASQPTAMASRNWILRRMMLKSIRQDPEYANGNYTSQPLFGEACQRVFCLCDLRRHPQLSETGADARTS